MRRTLDVARRASSCLAAVCLVLGICALPVGVMRADPLPDETVIGMHSCNPTDTKTGSAPCYDKAGARCYYNQKASTCTRSPNGSNCTCAPI